MSKPLAKRSQNFNTTYRKIVECNMLRAFRKPVATCWVVLVQIDKLEPTTPNMSQHAQEGEGGQTHAICCAQQCNEDMLR